MSSFYLVCEMKIENNNNSGQQEFYSNTLLQTLLANQTWEHNAKIRGNYAKIET